MTEVTELQDSLLEEVAAADSLDALEAVRVSALGKKGRITAPVSYTHLTLPTIYSV